MVERARANEKCTQDSDSNPSVSSDVLEDTAIGVGELDTKKAQCWFKQEYSKSNPPHDTLQRDICEWTNPVENGQGHSQPKGKGKARENIQEKGTTTRTRLDLRMKKLDSAGWMTLVLNVRELNLSVMSRSTMMTLNCLEWIKQLTCFVFKCAQVS